MKPESLMTTLAIVMMALCTTPSLGEAEGEPQAPPDPPKGIAVHNQGLSYLGLFKSAGTIGDHGRDQEKRDIPPATSQQTSYYFLSQNAAGHFTAERDCKDYLGEDATLAYIETHEEFKVLQKFLADSDDTGSTYWIGGKFDVGRRIFIWGNLAEIGPWAPWLEGHPTTRTSVTRVSVVTPTARAHAGVRFKTQMQTVSNRYICELKVGNPEEEALPCYRNNDLILLIDSSDKVTKAGYTIFLEFVTRFALAWIDNPGNHFGVIITSEHGQAGSVFNESFTASDLRVNYARMAHLGGKAAIEEGINKAIADFHKADRKGIKNLVILTESHLNGNADADWNKLKEAGVNTFAIGVGPEVTRPELLAITGHHAERVFYEDTIEKVLPTLQTLSTRVCETDFMVGQGLSESYDTVAHVAK